MTDEDFQRLIDTYGAAPHRWPDHLKAEALACLAASDGAQAALQRARILDDLLDAAEVRPLGDAGRVVARAVAAVQGLPPAAAIRARRRPGGWLSAGIVSGAMAAGIAVGLLIHPPAAGDSAEAGVTSLVLAPTVLSAMMDGN